MIPDDIFQKIQRYSQRLKLDLTACEAAKFVQENSISEDGVDTIARLLDFLCCRKDSTTLNFLLKTSRMPQKNPRTFDNFDEGNDPYNEHDFGAFDYKGHKIFWKIDNYDQKFLYLSPNACNPRLTNKVLTIMYAEEY